MSGGLPDAARVSIRSRVQQPWQNFGEYVPSRVIVDTGVILAFGQDASAKSSVSDGLRPLLDTVRTADSLRLVYRSTGAGKAAAAAAAISRLGTAGTLTRRCPAGCECLDAAVSLRVVVPWLEPSPALPAGETVSGIPVTDTSQCVSPVLLASPCMREPAAMRSTWPLAFQLGVSGVVGHQAASAIFLEAEPQPSRAEFADIDTLAAQLNGWNRAGSRHWRRLLRSFFDRVFARIGRAAQVVPLAPHEPCDLLPLRSALTPTAPPAAAA
ncbi:hypothetical protein [Frankia sp. AgW1.1]|nr:hypothetical protein [Frankia sp. AgW1.1]MBL7486538.1 hypothetical protein [Frankia sp. AgW1.1]